MLGLSGWLGGVGMWVGGGVGLGRFPCREKTVMETGNVYTTFHAKLLFSGREESHRIQFREIIPDFRIKYNKASFLAKPFVLQKLLGGRSIPWIELHDLPDKDSVFF